MLQQERNLLEELLGKLQPITKEEHLKIYQETGNVSSNKQHNTSYRVPARPGKPGKMRVHLKNLKKLWNIKKCNKNRWKIMGALKPKKISFTLLTFVGICLVIISDWSELYNRSLWFWWIECYVTDQFTGPLSVGVTPQKSQQCI